MNYTLNRPRLDGTSPARLKKVGSIAPEIKDYDSWYTAWLRLAKQAEAEKRWLDAASYYHGAEFYLPAGDVRKQRQTLGCLRERSQPGSSDVRPQPSQR